ncbi:hypothetical protein BDY19DRAFT_178615 [Irpex rosettiformis]|uniref:Uncharacterized protein n=1 Tax=Irpex rosettiformis TaxID=378272 RepID=A0ACB8U2X0_9APHY|nr:hypothetical protein BDY19DRAFT_178615 [Irpex rosettiformis]
MQSIAQLDSAAPEFQALCCAGSLNDAIQCAICPNPDLAGIGVRVAFYLQSIVNALLIAFSPSDSVPTAWAGTLLTLALVIASFVSKQGHNLTLHHATLVLNFVTLSTISSLAVAPMLPIWRLSPEEFYERHRRRHALLYADIDDPRYVNDPSVLNASIQANRRKLRIKKAQRRQRMIISFVLLLQVVLQWAWGISLFVDPRYSQDYLNNSTFLVLFLAPFETGSINNSKEYPHAGGFLIWAAWILFCLMVTMGLVVNLAMSGSSHSQTSLSSFNTGLGTGLTSYTSNTPTGRQWERVVRESVFLKVTWQQAMEGLRVMVFIGLWSIFIAASEWQCARNHLFAGENNFGGLGQITAMSVSLAPLWSLVVALNKYPSLRRKRQRFKAYRDRDDEEEEGQAGSDRYSDEVDETNRLLTVSQSNTHHRHPSDETLTMTGDNPQSESFQMDVFNSLHPIVDLNHDQPRTSMTNSNFFPVPYPSDDTPSAQLSAQQSRYPPSPSESTIPTIPILVNMPAPAETHPYDRTIRTTATPLALPLPVPFGSSRSSSRSGSSGGASTTTPTTGGVGGSSSGVTLSPTASPRQTRTQRPRGPRPASVSV